MNLQELEARLQSLIEVHLISVLPGQRAERLLVEKLTGALQSNAIRDQEGNLVAPDVYTVLAHPDSIGRWKNPELLDTLIDVLEAEAERGSLRLEARPTITIAEDPALAPGD